MIIHLPLLFHFPQLLTRYIPCSFFLHKDGLFFNERKNNLSNMEKAVLILCFFYMEKLYTSEYAINLYLHSIRNMI